MHIRQAIRENIKTTLTGLTTTGNNVFVTRVYPVAKGLTEGLIIYNENETVQYLSTGTGRSQERTCIFKVEAYVKTSSDFDDKMDTIMAEIESALSVDVTRGNLAIDTMIDNFDSDFNGEGELPVGIGTLDIIVKYLSTEGSPTT
jgi:hypothetical protein